MIGVSSTRPTDSTAPLRSVDWSLLAVTCALIAAGLLSIYSVGAGTPGEALFRRQLLMVAFGLGPFLLFAMVDPRFWLRHATWLYGVSVVLLSAVLFMGRTSKGAQRWVDVGPVQFQPSELAKILLVITLSAFFAKRLSSVQTLPTFLLSIAHVVPIAALVFLQPHLGSTLVMLAIWISVCILAGVRWRHLVGAIVVGAVLGFAAYSVPGVLAPYQKQRIEALFSSDEQGANYQTTRAKIAFGVGGLTGVGFMKGEQKQGRYIPEQHNDFVFTVIGEEGGLVGCTLILAGFGFFFYRAWRIMFETSEPGFKMMAAGIIGLLGFHTLVNLAMNLELIPVVGLWLPFMSSGGSLMWLCMACVGLLLAIRRCETPLLFRT